MVLKGTATFGCLPMNSRALHLCSNQKKSYFDFYGFSLTLGVTENIRVAKSKPGASYLMVTRRQRGKYQEGARAKI